MDYLGGHYAKCNSESRSVASDSLRPNGLHSPRNSPGQNTGVGSLSILQGIFPTQGSNPGLQHCRRTLPAKPPGKPNQCEPLGVSKTAACFVGSVLCAVG